MFIFIAILGTLPALSLRAAGFFSGQDVELPALAGALIFGTSIISAAFLVSWTAEAAQKDISQALSIAFVALIAVLPEYAVDVVLAWKAGADPSGPYIHYAAANMTGANRLLVGFGWPLVFFLFWIRNRAPLRLDKAISLELVPLALATGLSFFIFFQGGIELWHSGVLLAIFVLYIWMTSRSEVEEPDLLGPAEAIGSLSKRSRTTVIWGLFAFSALGILASAEPFVESLLHTGETFGVDEFLLVQWLAPLASESPELLIACIFAFRGQAVWAIVTLISSKVNQWSLLVASLPITYSISLGDAAPLSLDARQVQEFLLTSAQSLFAVVLLVRLRVTSVGAGLLFFLFITQLFFTATSIRYVYSFIYLGLTLGLLLKDGHRIRHVGILVQDFLGKLKGSPASEKVH